MDQALVSLDAVVAAAGMTAFADDVVTRPAAPKPAPKSIPDQLPPTLH